MAEAPESDVEDSKVQRPRLCSVDMLCDLCELSAIAHPHASAIVGDASCSVDLTTGWKEISAVQAEPAKGIRVERLDGWRGRKPAVLRCTTSAPGCIDPQNVSKLFDQLALREKWDENIAVTERVEQLGADGLAGDRYINRTQTKSALGGLVSPRDFLSYGIERAISADEAAGCQYYFLVSQPCRHPSYPPNDSAIRAQAMHFSLSFVREAAHINEWTVEYIVQVELNGWLPRGPILTGTINSIKSFLRHLSTNEF